MAIMQIEVEDPPQPPTGLMETDGVPMESDWHRFVGGNMFIYFNVEQIRTRDYRGPDFFFVWGRPLNPPRPYYAIWEEGGKYPDVIVELSSPSTAAEDVTVKKDIYEQTFRTHEYFVYNPDERTMVGWRWTSGGYETIEPNERGWLWSEELSVFLGVWQGEFQGKVGAYVRFFDTVGRLIETRGEAESRNKDFERQRADAERAAKDAEREAKEVALKRFEVERQRAEAAEAELAKLKAQVASGGKSSNP